jgi:hypothetical protein
LNCDEDTSVVEQESPDLPPPGVFYRRICEDYLREAECSFNFNVYKMEGWLTNKGGEGGGFGAGFGAGGAGPGGAGGAGPKADVKSKPKDDDDAGSGDVKSKPNGTTGGGTGSGGETKGEASDHDQLIPFIQRAEIGVIAHSERFREQSKGKCPEYSKPDDALKDKSQSTDPPDTLCNCLPLCPRSLARVPTPLTSVVLVPLTVPVPVCVLCSHSPVQPRGRARSLLAGGHDR